MSMTFEGTTKRGLQAVHVAVEAVAEACETATDAMGEYEDAQGSEERGEIRTRFAEAVGEALSAADRLRTTATRWADRA